MRIAFTGTRNIRRGDERLIEAVISSLPADAELVVGACRGVDGLVARIGYAHKHRVHAVLPASRSQVDPYWHWWCTSHEEMPKDTDYRARDTRLVQLGERLIAFPDRAEDHPTQRRSGTWMTVRIARRAHKPVDIHILHDGGQS